VTGPVRPAGWASPAGYADGVAARGRLIFAAGQVGWDPATHAFESDDFLAQARRALENVAAVLRAAGAEPRHLVRLTWFVTSKAEYRAARRELGRAYREVLGEHYPAMSLLVVHELLEDRAKVEIEATAVVPE